MSRSPSPCGARRAGALAAALVGVVLCTAAFTPGGHPRPTMRQESDARPIILDITAPILDISIPVESLDSSVINSQSSDQVQLILATDVLFAFDQATLSPRAKAAIDETAEVVRAQAKGTVRIDGHTDSKGDDAYNLELSRRRAQAVQQALAPLLGGVPVRLEVAGHGETQPFAANTNPDGSDNPRGRAKNRRVTITFAK
jgi:OmpA-OmpF porin, OOP family